MLGTAGRRIYRRKREFDRTMIGVETQHSGEYCRVSTTYIEVTPLVVQASGPLRRGGG